MHQTHEGSSVFVKNLQFLLLPSFFRTPFDLHEFGLKRHGYMAFSLGGQRILFSVFPTNMDQNRLGDQDV